MNKGIGSSFMRACKRFGIVLGFITLVASGCSTVNSSDNLNKDGIALKPSETVFIPTVEITNTPKLPPTSEPTLNPRQLADEYGLNSDRVYVREVITTTEGVQYEVLLDNFTKSPKLLFVDGKFVKLDEKNQDDRELMWGHLVPKDRVYIDNDKHEYNDDNTQDNFVVLLSYLGDVAWEDETIDGKMVKVPYLLVGLRDYEGRLHIAKYGIDGVNEEEYHWFEYNTFPFDTGNSEYIQDAISIDDVIRNDFEPGDVFLELIDNQGIIIPVWPKDEVVQPGPENRDLYFYYMQTLFNTEKQKMMTTQEWEALSQGLWPDNVLYLYARYGITKVVGSIPQDFR
jgi:hypothetical protein